MDVRMYNINQSYSNSMDLDFILFNPPKHKYSFVDLWGQVIFVPKTRKKQKYEGGLAAFLNCYQSSLNEAHLTVDTNLVEIKSALDLESKLTRESSRIQEQQVQKYIPCLYLNSLVGSRYLLLYFHSSGQDIKLCHKLLDFLRNLFQINVIAMEYSGYSIYKGKADSDIIKSDSQFIYNYAVNKLGFRQENIIVVGRSIGTGIALELLQKTKPGALALISPFASIKSLAREFAGFLGQLCAKQTYDNRSNIMSVSCPTFLVHGLKDQTISHQNTKQLAKLCYQKCQVVLPPKMTHSTFDFYCDLADPLRQFLMDCNFNFYEPNQQGPVVPNQLFQCPQNFTF